MEHNLIINPLFQSGIGRVARLMLLIIVCFILTPTLVLASQKQKPSSTALFVLAGKSSTPAISKSRAISSVKSQLKGKVLSARLIKSKGPFVYKVKILLAKGRIRTVFVDGHSGKIIRIN